MAPEFEKAWSDLNLRLRELERGGGLSSALRALEEHHLDNGFIRDRLQDVERHTISHPRDPGLFFRVQYNPGRARRFAGSGRNGGESLSLNNGCFLCRENIRRQQDGAQLGYQIMAGGRTYVALTNPFPLLPEHIVIAATEHRPQEWAFHGPDGFAIQTLIDDLVSLADRMPGHLGFYNGVGAGASIPGHLHFQFFRRPGDDRRFPMEIAAEAVGGEVDGPAVLARYPIEAVVWKGRADDVIARATHWMAAWGERNRGRLAGLTANLIAARDDDHQVTLYFVPRDRARARPDGFAGLVGGLEVLGEIVLSSGEEKARLDAGKIDYFALEATLASVSTPVETADAGA